MCSCQLCGFQLFGPPQAETHGIEAGSEQGKVIDYDALASHMWKHISDRHPEQMNEGIMQQRRAAKMYAMNWANIAAELEPVRVQHRAQLLMALTVTTQFEAAPAVASSPSSEGAGSNEKKSERNVSN